MRTIHGSISKEVPEWIEQFISALTGGFYNTIDEIMKDESGVDSMFHYNLFNSIEQLVKFHKIGIIKAQEIKPITEVSIGQIFKIYHDQERYYQLNSTKVDNEMIQVREFMGGRGNGFSSSWLGQSDNCHADIEVMIVSSLPDKFL